jgi:hypothetical protein
MRSRGFAITSTMSATMTSQITASRSMTPKPRIDALTKT